jgi:hypothetical protein
MVHPWLKIQDRHSRPLSWLPRHGPLLTLAGLRQFLSYLSLPGNRAVR